MQSRSFVLLKNLLRSTSGINILKYEKDSKKKKTVVGNIIGSAILYLLLMALVIAIVIGYGMMGLAEAIPVLACTSICIMQFFFTILKTNGYLFAFKEYDMLMALPFKPSEIAGTKFLYMYIKSLPWVSSISLAALIGYGVYARPGVLTYILWIVLSTLVPLIPMVIASAIGALIAGIGSGFRHKQLVQTVLTFVFILICFASRFVIEAMVRNNQVQNVLNEISSKIDLVKRVYFPAKWFEEAILKGNILSVFLFAAVSLGVFAAFAALVGRSYRKINSRLMTGVARKKYKMSRQKKKSVINAVAFKEFKRFTSSTLYITNMGFGEVLALAMAIGVLFVDMNSVIYAMTQGAPITKENLIPSIPFIVYFVIGMAPTTTASLSLEGKNFWIIKSLPVEMKEVILGKIAFNMYLTLPFMALASLSIGIKCGASFVEILLFLLLGTELCAFSSLFGMICNLKHCSFDWENEIDVVKKGASVGIYILINMTGSCLFLFGAVFMGFKLSVTGIMCTLCVFFAILSFICYKGVVIKTKKL